MPKPIAAYAVSQLTEDGKIKVIEAFPTHEQATTLVRLLRSDEALTHVQRMSYIMTPIHKGQVLLPPGDLPSIGRTNADDMKK
jgi:hypothetical protein